MTLSASESPGMALRVYLGTLPPFWKHSRKQCGGTEQLSGTLIGRNLFDPLFLSESDPKSFAGVVALPEAIGSWPPKPYAVEAPDSYAPVRCGVARMPAPYSNILHLMR